MKKKLSPYFIILLAFASFILVGSFLLWLPISTNKGSNLSYIDALFTAGSAVCVTGLSTVDIEMTLSPFGIVVLAILIQGGGLGLVTVGIFFLSMLGIQFGVKERLLLKESLNQNSLQGLVKLVKTILIITLIIESVGTLINMIVFVPEFGFWKGLGVSIFQAISSFNNAGFDILPGESLIPYRNNVLLLLNTSFLIILGGIGYIVILDIINFRKNGHFSIHTKICVSLTLILLLSSTLLFKITSWNQLSFLDAFFQGVSVRTAGFNSVDLTKLNDSTILLMNLFMFIGCCPVSTGGGIKTTTLFILLLSVYKFATGKPCVAFKRKFSDSLVLKAFWISFLGIIIVFGMTLGLSVFEGAKDFSLKEISFEAFSGFATVGLSLGITSQLTTASKLVLLVGMFVGRLGPLTVASLLNSRWNISSNDSIDYVKEKLIIG